jgi:lipid-binding SYLF domain-containing protein
VLFLAAVTLVGLLNAPVVAAGKEQAIVEAAVEVVEGLATIPLKGIPPALMQDAQGIAIIPGLIKAGFVVGGRHGRGVVLARQPDGSWSNPLFLSLTGGSIGWQIGVQSTDLVLIFKTRKGVARLLEGKGKLTLGGDVAVAAGPVGRQAEAGTDAQLQAEIFSYSRSRGLFAGLSLEGAVMLVDAAGNDRFYRARGVGAPLAAEQLKAALARLSAPLAPPPGLVPLPAPPPPAEAPLPPPTPLPPPY